MGCVEHFTEYITQGDMSNFNWRTYILFHLWSNRYNKLVFCLLLSKVHNTHHLSRILWNHSHCNYVDNVDPAFGWWHCAEVGNIHMVTAPESRININNATVWKVNISYCMYVVRKYEHLWTATNKQHFFCVSIVQCVHHDASTLSTQSQILQINE